MRQRKGNPDPLADKPELYEQRQKRNMHNGFSGTIGIMQVGCRVMMDATTTTKKAKRLAFKINSDLDKLRQALRTRIDT